MRAIELALAAAYRKDFGNKLQNIITEFDSQTGGVKVFDVKTVVDDLPEEELAEELAAEAAAKKSEKKEEKTAAEEASAFISEEADGEEEVRRFNPKTEIQLKDARLIDKKYKIGDTIVTPLAVPGAFGRMAAQTAKQVIVQKIREEERQNIYDEYKALENQVVNGMVQRREGRNVLVDLEHATAIMPPDEQVERERYSIGNRLKFYLKSVAQTSRGPQLIVSRVNPEIIRKIFETEIPEIANNLIEIKAIAREAGNRTKVAIMTSDENIDPIGSCVGQRGTRIQTIISELNGEKIDIILWDEDPVKFISNALSPAKVVAVEFEAAKDEAERRAMVKVKDDQLSLAIGRAGQNVRLASRLTGFKIDIISDSVRKAGSLTAEKVEPEKVAEVEATQKKESIEETVEPEELGVKKETKEKKKRGRKKKEKTEEVETEHDSGREEDKKNKK